MPRGPLRLARSRSGNRAFTLVELLTGVAIVGVLAAIGVVLVRQHFRSAKMTEGMAAVQRIRSAQSARRAETGTYLDCSSSSTAWYPAPPSEELHSWMNTTHGDWSRWQGLGLSPRDGTRFGFLVNAGLPGKPMTKPAILSSPPTLTSPTDPWFVIQGVADSDGDTNYAKIVATSLNGEVFTEDETE
jgi:prepilin-type N-terminal cleavage/methylation domain-containing protein